MDKTLRVSFDGEKLKRLAKNALFFTAPALLLFFEALRQGLSVQKAGYILLIALYGLVADFLRKLISVETPQK